MPFIKFTSYDDGEPIFINPNQICALYDYFDNEVNGTVIHMVSGINYCVKESCDLILSSIRFQMASCIL